MHNVCSSVPAGCQCGVPVVSHRLGQKDPLASYVSLVYTCEIRISTVLLSPQEYQIDIIFAQTWVDTRLRYNSSSMRILTLNR